MLGPWCWEHVNKIWMVCLATSMVRRHCEAHFNNMTFIKKRNVVSHFTSAVQDKLPYTVEIRPRGRPPTGVNRCTFQWLISNDFGKKQMGFNSLIIHYSFVIIGINYENISSISLSKLISVALPYTSVFGVIGFISHYNTDSTSLKWSNTNIFWQWYGKFDFGSWCR